MRLNGGALRRVEVDAVASDSVLAVDYVMTYSLGLPQESMVFEFPIQDSKVKDVSIAINNQRVLLMPAAKEEKETVIIEDTSSEVLTLRIQADYLEGDSVVIKVRTVTLLELYNEFCMVRIPTSMFAGFSNMNL